MQFTKALVLLLAPVALAAEAASSPAPSAVHKTLTLVPPGYTPPTSTPTPTPTSTATPHTSTPHSSSSFSRSLTSTPLPKVTSSVPVEPNTGASQTTAASATTSSPPVNGASRQLPGAIAAGALAVAGLLMV